MTTTQSRAATEPRPERLATAPAAGRPDDHDPVAGWLANRGILFLLIQTPVIGLLVSYLVGLNWLTSAVFPVFVSFSVLTVWVVHRNARSTDRAEPVHRLHLYALFALLPVAAFSLVQVAFIGTGNAFWATWLEIGTQFTATTVNPWSFLAGAVWSLLAGVSLVIGYFVLYKRHSLGNAGAYFGLAFLAAVYVLPNFSPAIGQANGAWYLAQAVAFATLAVATAAMPTFWSWLGRPVAGQPRRPNPARVAALAAAVLVMLAPYAVAAERTANWYLAEQETRDLAAFTQVALEPEQAPELLEVDARSATYQYSLRLGPRLYTTANGVERAVDVGPLSIEGRLEVNGTAAAWCSSQVAEVASPNAVRAPADFAMAASRLEHVDITVSCAGPAAAVEELLCPSGGTVTASWRAEATLRGERITEQRAISGQATTNVELSANRAC